jgi:hypothetical protein
MKKGRVRIVLDDHVTEDALTAVASDKQWMISRRTEREGDQPNEFIYSTQPGSGGTDIHWIEDHKIGVNYILVQGPETKKVVEILHDKLDYLSSETILEEARDSEATPNKRGIALYNLALDKIEGGYDKETFDLFVSALTEKSATVRGAAVLAIAYLGWPQFIDSLRPLSTDSESDESVREDAALLLRRLEKHK